LLWDRLGGDFSALALKIRQRVKLGDLLHSYTKEETAHAFDGDPIWKLRLSARGQQKLRSSAESILPDELWVRQSLLAVTISEVAM
jgi:hypothetical protein